VSVVKVASAGEEPILGADFLTLKSESRTLESIAGYVLRDGVIKDGSEPERIRAALVSADFFPALGLMPALGRAFISGDGQSGGAPVVVISQDLWQRRFGADPHMIGRTITLNQERYTIVGVMPVDIKFPNEAQVWTPLTSDDERLRQEDKSLELEVIARLKPGVTRQQAQEEMSNIARTLERDYPATNSGRDIKLVPLRENRSKQ
jgi:hypothetical protein